MLNWKKKAMRTALALSLGLASVAAQAITLKISSPTNNDANLK